MTVMATGHRPDKLAGYDNYDHKIILFRIAEKHLIYMSPDLVISGMAQGWDMIVAYAALSLHIPLHCAIPFPGQERNWPIRTQEKYRNIINLATSVKYISDSFSYGAFQKRNEYMVDNSDIILACHDGSKGGTANCLKYADSKNKKVINIYKEYKNLIK